MKIGDTLTLTVDVTHGDPVSYVWEFWDGSTVTTSENTTTKVLNQGGLLLDWNVTAVDAFGQSYVYSDHVAAVDYLPVISNVVVSANDGVLPYDVTVSADIEDLTSGGVVVNVSLWRVGGGSALATVTTTSGANRSVSFPSRSVDAADISAGWEIVATRASTTCTSTVPVSIRGIQAEPLKVTVAHSPTAKLGGYLSINVTVISSNGALYKIGPDDAGSSIVCGFSAQTWPHMMSTTYPCAVTSVGGSTWNGTVVVPISALEDQGQKDFVVTATAVRTGQDPLITVQASTVTLVKNSLPVIQGFALSSDFSTSSLARQPITALVTDADGDPISYHWRFTHPPGVNQYVNPASVGSASLGTSRHLAGTVTVSDVDIQVVSSGAITAGLSHGVVTTSADFFVYSASTVSPDTDKVVRWVVGGETIDKLILEVTSARTVVVNDSVTTIAAQAFSMVGANSVTQTIPNIIIFSPSAVSAVVGVMMTYPLGAMVHNPPDKFAPDKWWVNDIPPGISGPTAIGGQFVVMGRPLTAGTFIMKVFAQSGEYSATKDVVVTVTANTGQVSSTPQGYVVTVADGKVSPVISVTGANGEIVTLGSPVN